MTNHQMHHAATRLAGAREGATPFASSAPPTTWMEARQDVVQGAVRQLPGPDSSPLTPQPELGGTGFTYRHDWGARRGQWVLRLNWDLVQPPSRVFVAIGEGVPGGPNAGKFIGAARYTLHNVASRWNGVDIWVNIEWSSDISLYADYLVINP